MQACEAALDRPGTVDLAGLGLWKAVAAVKRRPQLVERYARRIARVDRDAFVRATRPLVFPAAFGIALEAAGTLLGIAIVVAAPALAEPWREIAYLVAAGALIGATHGLAHVVVGRAMGIGFTHWYSRPPRSPQPGFKTDYESYLRTPARSRAWMHASGAIVSKVIPFVLAPVAAAGGAEAWAVRALVALGAVQLVTDVTLSTRASDWKRFRREMRLAARH